MAFLYHSPRHFDGNYCVFPADMRAWEAAEIDEIPCRGRELMEIAGREVAMHVLEHFPGVREILIFCGSGNNGGDGLAAAWYLDRCGLDVQLVVFEEGVVRGADAKTMFERVRHLPRLVLREASEAGRILEWERRRDVLVIDGIFGTGYRPAHSALMTRVYQCIEQLSCPVVSIDIPSGIDAATGFCGLVDDETPPRALTATHTVTFGAPKVGHFVGHGPSHCGEVFCVDIGLRTWPGLGVRGQILSDEFCRDHYWRHFVRSSEVHKGLCGHVAVVGAEASMPGASCLSARAALRAGCGLVTLAARCPIRTCDEIMVRTILRSDSTLDVDALSEVFDRADCLVLGPGLGRDETAAQIVRACSRFTGRLVLDADALFILANEAIPFSAKEVFMTPHPAEAARLCGVSPREILYDPIRYVQFMAEKYAATVVLKSHVSLIASKKMTGLRLGILPYPNPAMATAGAGDTLAGILGGILAQTRGGAISHWFDAFEAASIAVSCHSMAGRKAAEARGNSLCASDIIEQISI